MTSTLIGHTGMIGQTLLDQHKFDLCYNSSNIDSFNNCAHDLVVCSAPSGNRLLINADSADDNFNLGKLMKVLASSSIKKFVLISSIDAINFPTTPYGNNRLRFENFIKAYIPGSQIVRLSSLVGKHIKKNMLYDLKHRVYLEHVNPTAKLQWYNLENLWKDIETITGSSVQTHNFVSEHIVNQEIITKFFPMCQVGPAKETTYRDIQPHWIDKQQIFSAMEKYLK